MDLGIYYNQDQRIHIRKQEPKYPIPPLEETSLSYSSSLKFLRKSCRDYRMHHFLPKG